MEEEISSSSSLCSPSIFTNYTLLSAVITFAISQSVKYRERQLDLKRLVGSGGMPSSHSATVAALAAAVGFRYCLGGSEFAIAALAAAVGFRYGLEQDYRRDAKQRSSAFPRFHVFGIS
ncbi:hypothetical protein CDL15_Pgr024489 [Punica granatum]|uniref:Acid phosphatase/vanadium-dependent haloperoxidase-related protein n=1 Tax=Punica granatum TaxID=22663 RepID=A0A218XYZ3_PUNGR|nr:hypothetical protein CDL15_Pgr024489 [Punica granatum]